MSKTAAGAQRRRPASWYQKLVTRPHRHLGISLVACLATLFSLVAQPVADVVPASAPFHPAGGQVVGNPGCDDPPGSCNINRDNGCPTAGPRQAPTDQHCVPIPGGLVIEPTTVGPPGATRCAGSFYAQVQLLPTLS